MLFCERFAIGNGYVRKENQRFSEERTRFGTLVALNCPKGRGEGGGAVPPQTLPLHGPSKEEDRRLCGKHFCLPNRERSLTWKSWSVFWNLKSWARRWLCSAPKSECSSWNRCTRIWNPRTIKLSSAWLPNRDMFSSSWWKKERTSRWVLSSSRVVQWKLFV